MGKRSREDSISTISPSKATEESPTSAGDLAAMNNPAAPRQSKEPQLDEGSQPPPQSSFSVKCSLPPHSPQTFNSLEDLEVHYQKSHVNRCLECYRNFPSNHFLELHISENHDPFQTARREHGEKTVSTAPSFPDI